MSQLDKHVQSASLSHRRRRRHRLVAAMVTAMVAAGVAVSTASGSGIGPSHADEADDDSAAAASQRRVTYAEGSTIHDGRQTVDVSPHEVEALVRTDDGFVFADQNMDVLFTDGDGVLRIGHLGGFWGDLALAADDTGSYVGWINGDRAVVYDTATETKVLRKRLPGDADDAWRSMAAIDRARAYVPNNGGVDVWNLASQTKTTIDRSDKVGDVAGGYYLWIRPDGKGIVSRSPLALRPAFGVGLSDEGHLSPGADYVIPAGGSKVVDRETRENVSPYRGSPSPQNPVIVQWLDDDRFVIDSDNMHTAVNPDPHRLQVCSISAGSCQTVARSLGKINYADGIAHEGAWQG